MVAPPVIDDPSLLSFRRREIAHPGIVVVIEQAHVPTERREIIDHRVCRAEDEVGIDPRKIGGRHRARIRDITQAVLF